MNRKFLIFLATIFISSGMSHAQHGLIVKFKPSNSGKSAESIIKNDLLQRFSASEFRYHKIFQQIKLSNIKDNIGFNRIFRFDFKNEDEKSEFLSKISSVHSIEYVQEPVSYRIDGAPNDSLINEQWGLKKIGALKVFDLIEDTGIQLNDVLVAVIDTGIDDEHPDLGKSIYLNSGEIGMDEKGNDKRFNGIDDDNNGFVDDYKGFDFVDKNLKIENPSEDDYKDWDNMPDDEHGHGTNIAGIIAAEINNGKGISGLAPNTKILNLRAFDATGNGEDDDVAAAIMYAVNAGAKIINMSFGDDKFSFLLKDAIRFAYDNGVMMVASSGNSSSDLPHYPSSFSEVISVGASDENDYVASFSNYGSTLDLVAPGVSILTTANDGTYGSVSGTSAAAPFVTGAAAVLMGYKSFETEEIKQIIKSTATDINASGWDLNSGAGRLNLFNAVTTLTPGIIKINLPLQDFSTFADSLEINLTVISPYFDSFSLQYGIGFNPETWITVPVEGNKQIFNENVATLDISGFPDTVYTLRLVVNLTNENNQEERINFYVDHTPPNAYLVNGGTALLGKDVTIMASIYSEEQATVKMFFKLEGKPDYDFVYLDQFNTNTKTVYTTHFGYIPLEKIVLNETYQVYFEVENLAGIKTIIDNDGAPFEYEVSDMVKLKSYAEMDYGLPPGRIFNKPVFLDSSATPYVFLNSQENSSSMQIYRYAQNKFTLIDSLDKRIPKATGDFNGNGKVDLLSLFLRNGYIDEQTEQGSYGFTTYFSDSTGNFWPATAKDLDGDGMTEIVTFADSSFAIYEIQQDLAVKNEAEFLLPDENQNGYVGAPNVALCDLNNDGVDEIWFMTSKGVLNGYRINGMNSYEFYQRINFGLDGSRNIIAEGDYDGDGIQDLAVLLKSQKNNDIAPFYILIVFNLFENQLNLITMIAFIDAGSEISSGFTRKKYSLEFADLTKNNTDELLLNVYPFFYVFEREQDKDNVIFFTGNINTTNIFHGDLNKNGAYEIGINSLNGVKFFEINSGNTPLIPKISDFYSIDSNKTYILWEGTADNFIIFKGLTDSTLSVFDTVTQNFMIDSVKSGVYNYYAVKSVVNGSTSSLSDVITIYSHAPAELDSVRVINANSIIVTFTEKVKIGLEDPNIFILDDKILPNTVVASSQYSYLLKFTENLEVGEHMLRMKSFRDFYNSPIKPDSISFVISGNIIDKKLFVESFNLINSKTLKLIFNLKIDENSAIEKENYKFTPENEIKTITLGADFKSVIITAKYPLKSIGKEYTLKISNIRSSVESGNIEISEESGSIVVLSSFENDLAEIYTYPNPVSLVKSNSITFAKLTRFAEVTVFGIDGKKIITLMENDGNGGITWDLRDESGSKVATGIYVYYVKALDEDGNTIETKVGKFAVIK